MYKIIDMNESPRKAEFDRYAKASYPYCCLTVDVDVTALLGACRAKGKSFNIALTHAVAVAADEIPVFRQRISGDTVKEYDKCTTYHIELTDADEVRYCSLRHDLPVKEHFEYAEKQIAEVKASRKLVISDTEDMYFTSSIPWVGYTQAVPASNGESNPQFVWGGFRENAEGRIIMPFTVQVHHALVDGLSMVRFYGALDGKIDALAKEILRVF